MSHNPEILENWITFRDIQMLLLSFFEIPNGEKLAKNVQKQYVQVIPRSTGNITKPNINTILLGTMAVVWTKAQSLVLFKVLKL